jgi:hypothetical protein
LIRKYIVLILMLTILTGTATAVISSEGRFSTSAYNQPVFSMPLNLSDDGNASVLLNATNPDVMSVGLHVYVVWSEYSTGIYFRESTDGGVTWNPPLNDSATIISRPGGRASAPLLSANGSNVYVVWSQYYATQAQVFEATSTNYGVSFGIPVQLTNVPYQPAVGPAITPVVASWGSTVAVAYSANQQSYVLASPNNGSTWSTAIKFANNREPQVAVYQNNVYAVADGFNISATNPINYTVSNNAGADWSTPASFNASDPGSEAWVAAAGSNVYVAWEAKGGTSTIYETTSNDYGNTWSSVIELTNPALIRDAWAPMIWAYGNSSWIAVHTSPGGADSQVYVYTTTNAGATWSTPVSLSGPVGAEGTTSFPFTVSSSDGVNVFVAWSQQLSPNYWSLILSYSGDGGSTWTPAPGIDVSQNANGTQASNNNDLADAAIWSSGASVFATWQYWNDTTPQGSNIMFSSYVAPSPTTTTTTSSSGATTPASSTSTSSATGSSTTTTSSGSAMSTSTTSQSSTTTTTLGSSNLLLYAGIAAALVVIAAIVATVLFMRRRPGTPPTASSAPPT